MATAKRKQEVLDNQTDENSDVISDTEDEHVAKRQNLQWDLGLVNNFGTELCTYGLVIWVFVRTVADVIIKDLITPFCKNVIYLYMYTYICYLILN